MEAQVGRRVRLLRPDGTRERALILCASEADETYQVELDDGTEAVVPLSAVEQLQPFETLPPPRANGATPPPAVAEALKAEGNALFKLRDPRAALDRYLLGLRELQADCRFEAGGRCLLKPPGRARGAARGALLLVVAADGASADVEYEPIGGGARGGALGARVRALLEAARRLGHGEAKEKGEEEEEEEGEEGGEVEEDGVARERVAMLVHPTHEELQCALLLNASKCSLLLRRWGEALARAGRAERVAAHARAGAERMGALRRTAVAVSARAALGMQRFGAATSHASRLLALPPPSDPEEAASAVKEARALVGEIHRRVGEVQRSNKRLAKELSAWVSAAMSASEEHVDATPQPQPSRPGSTAQASGSASSACSPNRLMEFVPFWGTLLVLVFLYVAVVLGARGL
ncbi:hypothetical protein AB1Y20_008732 [Prymnesium parvum]|uniref:Peptidylprolyl isomerase n=1 Tax=Prymnesium parvum TaxID=97485 RepID=A0AB34ISG7_PRYPA